MMNPNGGCDSATVSRMRTANLTGRRFHRWTVLGMEWSPNHREWLARVQCSCEQAPTRLVRPHILTAAGGQRSRSCGCYRSARAREGWPGDLVPRWWDGIRRNAHSRGLPFELTPNEAWAVLMQQQFRCALTGVAIDLRDATASLDRLRPDEGYEVANVQWVHKVVNMMRLAMPLEHFRALCGLVCDETLRDEVADGMRRDASLQVVVLPPLAPVPPSLRATASEAWIGVKVGWWTVNAVRVGASPQWRAEGLCVCACGSAARWKPLTDLVHGNSRSCGCYRRAIQRGATHPSSTGAGGISGTLWASIRHSARSRGLALTLDPQAVWDLFIEQDGRCAITGAPLTLRGSRRPGTGSLDRVDHRQGYVPGNVRWVHADVNLMRGTMPDEEFITWCEAVHRYASTRASPEDTGRNLGRVSGNAVLRGRRLTNG